VAASNSGYEMKVEQVPQDDEQADEDIEETECGVKPSLSSFTNGSVYIIVYAMLDCFYGSTYTYANSTISTIEKRFKIPTTLTGKIKH
jgi:hypothetical protein